MPQQWFAGERGSLIFDKGVELRIFSSFRWMVKWKKVG